MKSLLINFADFTYRQEQKLNSQSGKEIGGFDNVISFSSKNIDKDFYHENKNVLRGERGAGYWLWKPYFIRKAMDNLGWGDVLFYSDSGSQFIRPVVPLIDICQEAEQNIVVFELSLLEKRWTKRDAFILLDCDNSKYTESYQRLASFSVWKKTNYTIDFIDNYLKCAQDERIITDINNQCGYPNYEDFVEHRHDQSVLSLLTKKHDIVAYRDPSQYGNDKMKEYVNSPYEQVISHTRKGRSSSFIKLSKKIQRLTKFSR